MQNDVPITAVNIKSKQAVELEHGKLFLY